MFLALKIDGAVRFIFIVGVVWVALMLSFPVVCFLLFCRLFLFVLLIFVMFFVVSMLRVCFFICFAFV